ncbi:MAG TPA: TetR/AcrR family transcriptional regulator [Roseiflexaceae bacterium]
MTNQIDSVGQDRRPWHEGIQSREEQFQLKRMAVLRTAAQTFNEIGFHQTSINDLARRLNVTKPMLYYYIGSKDDILFECNRLALENLADALAYARANGKTGIERLRLFLIGYVEMVTEDYGTCLVLYGNEIQSDEHRAKLRAAHRDVQVHAQELIAEGIADGSIAACDPKYTALTLFGALNWIPHWYRQGGQLTPHEIAEQFIAIFLAGLLPRDPRPAL